MTIDPARRLRDALGLEELGNEPHRVEGVDLAGELWAMQLDAKRTFDDLIELPRARTSAPRATSSATASTASCRAR